MPAANTIKQSSNNIKIGLLSCFILIALSIVFTFSYRERIILSVTNYFTNPYGIKVEEFNGLTIEFDMQQPFFIDNISINEIGLNIDYLQFERVAASKANQAGSKTATAAISLPKLPNWIPDLHIASVAVQGINLPRVAELIGEQKSPLSNLTVQTLDNNLMMFNTITFKELDFKYHASKAEFGVEIWQQAAQLVQAKWSYAQNPYQNSSHQTLQVTLTTDLTHLTATAKQFLPRLESAVSGVVVADIVVTDINSESVDNVAFTLSLTGAGLSHNEQLLMADTDLSVDTVLTFDGQKWSPEQTTINVARMEPITLTAKYCAASTTLLGMKGVICQSFNKGASPRLSPIVITPELPLLLLVDIQGRDIERWTIQANRLAMKAVMADNMSETKRNNHVDVKAENILLTSGAWLADWSLALKSNSRYFSEMDVPLLIKSSGQVEVNPTVSSPKIKLTVKQALLSAPEFRYTVKNTELSSTELNQTEPTNTELKNTELKNTELKNKVLSGDNIKLSLQKKMTVKIENNKVLPFDFALSTASYNNRYQNNALSQYEIARFTGQHQGHFSPALLSVNSGWQLDDLELKSNNTVQLLNFAPQSIKGNIVLPSQHIPSLISEKYPLPSGLYLPAVVTNRLDYTVKLNQQQGYLSANMAGNLIADSSTFNEVTATDINTHWRCKIAVDKPDLAGSAIAKCNLNAAVASVDVGPVVSDINLKGLATYTAEQLQVVVDNASAKAFSSTISLSPLLITDFNHIVGQVHVRNLSLSEVLELYQVPGVKVTGLLKADLPFVVKGREVSITDGWIEQEGAGGVIEIKDNATIDQLKLTQPQLRYALELLENLHYDTLHSDVNFKPSGDTKLTINIKGRNPSVERPIEFNYSHEENILQLFRSLRINDSMYDALDKMNNP